jgi:hypothetical protein
MGANLKKSLLTGSSYLPKWHADKVADPAPIEIARPYVKREELYGKPH